MKRKKSSLLTCFALFLTFALLMTYKVDTTNVSADSPISQSVLLDKQKKSSEQNDKILKFFEDQNKFSYPNYYAGSYLDNNGDLIVMLSDDSPSSAIFIW